MLIIKQF